MTDGPGDKVRMLDDEGTAVKSVLDHTASLEDGALIPAKSHQPFVAAARALI